MTLPPTLPTARRRPGPTGRPIFARDLARAYMLETRHTRPVWPALLSPPGQLAEAGRTLGAYPGILCRCSEACSRRHSGRHFGGRSFQRRLPRIPADFGTRGAPRAARPAGHHVESSPSGQPECRAVRRAARAGARHCQTSALGRHCGPVAICRPVRPLQADWPTLWLAGSLWGAAWAPSGACGAWLPE